MTHRWGGHSDWSSPRWVGECEARDTGLEVMGGVRLHGEYVHGDQGMRAGHIRVLAKQVEENECVITQSCLTLCDPMGCSPSGSTVRGVLPARILEWVAIPCSRGSS